MSEVRGSDHFFLQGFPGLGLPQSGHHGTATKIDTTSAVSAYEGHP